MKKNKKIAIEIIVIIAIIIIATFTINKKEEADSTFEIKQDETIIDKSKSSNYNASEAKITTSNQYAKDSIDETKLTEVIQTQNIKLVEDKVVTVNETIESEIGLIESYSLKTVKKSQNEIQKQSSIDSNNTDKIVVNEEVKSDMEEILTKKFLVSGKITDASIGTEHIATITIYLSGMSEAISTMQTNTDGTYEIWLEQGEYDVVITKPGYLSYTVKNIQVGSIDEIQIDEKTLIAGDINGDGEIELSDLVEMNDNIGITITDENREDKSIYDLNEDGVVNSKDQKILKANYGKEAEIAEYELRKDKGVNGEK
jgi:hypothetical protein